MYVMARVTKEEILHCPRCNEVMIHDRGGFWKCPKCGGEFWDDESKLAIIRERESALESDERLRAQLRWSLSKRFTEVPPLVPVIDPRSRGSRSSKRKKPLPKLLMAERHLLF